MRHLALDSTSDKEEGWLLLEGACNFHGAGAMMLDHCNAYDTSFYVNLKSSIKKKSQAQQLQRRQQPIPSVSRLPEDDHSRLPTVQVCDCQCLLL